MSDKWLAYFARTWAHACGYTVEGGWGDASHPSLRLYKAAGTEQCRAAPLTPCACHLEAVRDIHQFSKVRRHLQPHTGVRENNYFVVCMVIFLSFASVVFLVLSFVPVIFLSFFSIVFCHFSAIFYDFLWFFDDFFIFLAWNQQIHWKIEEIHWKNKEYIWQK